MNILKRPIFATIAVLAIAALAACGQGLIVAAQRRELVKSDAVTYLYPEQVNVPAGRPSRIALHFRVAPGLHINSHAPSEEFLIPTTFSIPSGSGVKLQSETYPAGTVTTMPIDPTTKLSVYMGDFIIQARVVAAAGNHLMHGQLHYQACDKNECLPPKTITVAVDVIGK